MTAEAHPPSPLDGAIPAGTFAIEASAGTGKTYALSALVARHLAETDTTTGSVLVVTYTRAAANELRSRVRNQLIDLGRYLVADEPETTASPWMADLRADDPDERSRRCDRVAQAVTDFDAMTVATIHSFAHQVLTSIGTAAGADPDVVVPRDPERSLADLGLRHPLLGT